MNIILQIPTKSYILEQESIESSHPKNGTNQYTPNRHFQDSLHLKFTIIGTINTSSSICCLSDHFPIPGSFGSKRVKQNFHIGLQNDFLCMDQLPTSSPLMLKNPTNFSKIKPILLKEQDYCTFFCKFQNSLDLYLGFWLSLKITIRTSYIFNKNFKY